MKKKGSGFFVLFNKLVSGNTKRQHKCVSLFDAPLTFNSVIGSTVASHITDIFGQSQ